MRLFIKMGSWFGLAWEFRWRVASDGWKKRYWIEPFPLQLPNLKWYLASNVVQLQNKTYKTICLEWEKCLVWFKGQYQNYCSN